MESRQNETLQNENLSDHEDTCTEVPTFTDKEILPSHVHIYCPPVNYAWHSYVYSSKPIQIGESRQNETIQNENLSDHEDTCTEVYMESCPWVGKHSCVCCGKPIPIEESRQNENLSDHEDTCTEEPTFADKEILPGNVHIYFVPNSQVFRL